MIKHFKVLKRIKKKVTIPDELSGPREHVPQAKLGVWSQVGSQLARVSDKNESK